MMNVLIVGVDSFLGKQIFFEFEKNENLVVRGTSKSPKNRNNIFKLDLMTNPSSKDTRLQGYDVVIFLPGMTKTLDINRNHSQAKQVNLIQSLKWIEFLSENGAKIVFPSSSAVYGNTVPYPREFDEVNPNSYYGELKLQVERSIIHSGIDYVIIRLTKVVSQNQPLFLNWRDTLHRNESISAFCETHIAPIHVTQAAYMLKILALNSSPASVINISGGENLSYFAYATMFAASIGAKVDLVQKTQLNEEYVSQSQFAALNVQKAIEEFGFVPPTAADTLELMLGEKFE
jgi:dTDP-4-dehydrorhamnose reductase